MIFLRYVSRCVWLGSLTVTCWTCNPEVTQRRRFDSAPGHCRVTTWGKLFTHVPLSPSSIIWYRLHRWDVNRHTVRYTGPIFVVSQCKNWCLAEGLRKRRSAPPYGLWGSGRTLRYVFTSQDTKLNTPLAGNIEWQDQLQEYQVHELPHRLLSDICTDHHGNPKTRIKICNTALTYNICIHNL